MGREIGLAHSVYIEMVLEYSTVNHLMISLLHRLLTFCVIILTENAIYLTACV